MIDTNGNADEQQNGTTGCRMATPSGRDEVIMQTLQVLSALDADVHFRYLLVKAKCEEMERVLAYVDGVRVARSKAQEAAQRRQDASHAESRSLESSIDDAIRRARRIRLEMDATKSEDAANDPRDNAKTGSKLPPQSSSQLDQILAQAEAIRGIDQQQQREGSATPREILPSMSQPTRLEYPRRMKALMGKLDDMVIAEQEHPLREAFCRKMTEHVSLRESGAPRSESKDALRVQVSYAEQVKRLRLAHQQLRRYVEAKANPQTDAVQNALSTPSISTVFPVYCRLKQAKSVFVELKEATARITEQLPPRPRLSETATAHRNAMMERLRKTTPAGEATAASPTSNRILLTSHDGTTHFKDHELLFEKLQSAWEKEPTSPTDQTTTTPYRNALNECMLSQISNLVLSAFQFAFCDGEQAPTQGAMRELMNVIRVAESAVVFEGRRQRSAVRR